MVMTETIQKRHSTSQSIGSKAIHSITPGKYWIIPLNTTPSLSTAVHSGEPTHSVKVHAQTAAKDTHLKACRSETK